MLWQRDAMKHEIILARTVVSQVLENELFSGKEQEAVRQLFQTVFPKDRRGGVQLNFGELKSVVPRKFELAAPLAALVSSVPKASQELIKIDGSFWDMGGMFQQALYIVMPIEQKGRVVGSIAVAHSLVPYYARFRQAERSIAVYICINILILTVVGFFRLVHVVVKPIDRLVRLTDQYHDIGQDLFAAGSGGNEFGKLTTSLNSMLSRIKQDRKALQQHVEELDLANKQLQQNQQEMIRTEKLASTGRLAAGLAHEIGNPLGVVQGYLGLLAQSGSQSDEHREFIRRADQELQRVNELIRQMLDFTRVSHGEPELFSLHQLLASIVDTLRIQPVFTAIQLESRLDAESDTVYADQNQIRQVFVNCLLNSADAVASLHSDGGGIVTVSTELTSAPAADDQTVLLCVRIVDNGVGIAEDQLLAIFDPFYTTKEPGKGTGLGLSVSLSIIESAGGRMEMESIEGQGSVLSVFLPAYLGVRSCIVHI